MPLAFCVRQGQSSPRCGMIIEIVFQGFEDTAWPARWTWNGTIGY
jgi:hypothetical protein